MIMVKMCYNYSQETVYTTENREYACACFWWCIGGAPPTVTANCYDLSENTPY